MSLQNLTLRHYYFYRKSITQLRSGGVGALVNLVKKGLKNRPKAASKSTWDLLCAKLQGQALAVVVDHDIGGGANIYRGKHISERCAKGETVLLFSFHILSMQYFVEVNDKVSSRCYAIDSLEKMLMLAFQGEVRHLLYNCAVSFRQPLAVVEMMATLKKNTSCEFIVAMHDYFIICPSPFLIDNKNEYCDVPDISICNHCLQQHQSGFISLNNTRDISHWRYSWSNLLKVADEVLMFSNSSRRLLKKAYPSLNDTNWSVVPHSLHTPMPKVDVLAGNHLHIGIVGVIGGHKGINIVRALTSEITRRKSNTKITVIGTLDAKLPSEVVTVTGQYEPNQLAELIKKSGANVFLLPSIVPETFSYVAHELVAMEVPFACFNLGAPAELVRTYKKGLILGNKEAGEVLTELESFWFKIFQIPAQIGQGIQGHGVSEQD